MRSPKRFERVKMNLGTGVAVITCPLKIGPDGAGYGCVLDGGAWQIRGYDENGLCRSMNGSHVEDISVQSRKELDAATEQ